MILNAIATYPDSSVLGYISALLVPRDRWRYSQQRHHLHLLATWLRTECLQIIDVHVTLRSCIGSRTLYRTMFSQKLEFFVHLWAHECGPIISDHKKQHCRNKRWLLGYYSWSLNSCEVMWAHIFKGFLQSSTGNPGLNKWKHEVLQGL